MSVVFCCRTNFLWFDGEKDIKENINVYSKVVRRSTCGGLGTDNWLWGILKPRTNANGNLEKKKDAETEVGTEVHEKKTNAKGNLEKF